jgi:hypothetical protein
MQSLAAETHKAEGLPTSTSDCGDRERSDATTRIGSVPQGEKTNVARSPTASHSCFILTAPHPTLTAMLLDLYCAPQPRHSGAVSTS